MTSPEDLESDQWLTVWEASTAAELEGRTTDLADLESERLAVGQKLWLSFQNTATAIAQVYMDKGSGGVDAFRNAARDATALYKEGLDSGRRLSEISVTHGYNRRTKEVLQWAKKRRKFIRRDELIAMLAGVRKPAPNPQTHHHVVHHPGFGLDDESDLATFRAAVGSRHPNLHSLVTTEFQRVNKRSSSPQSDVHMDSPQPKKGRFF